MNHVHKGVLRVTGGLVLLSMAGLSASAAQITISGNGDYRAGEGGEFNVRAADAGGVTLLEAANLAAYTVVNGTTVGTANGTRMNAGYSGQVGFETFCIEKSEFISLPGTYTAAISRGAIYGGVAGGIDHDSNPTTPTTDFVSVGTAYLYNHFARGTLTDALVGQGVGSGYEYQNGASRAADAVVLQKAIWYLEDEITYAAAGGDTNPFLQAAFAAYGTPGLGIGHLAGGAKADNTVWGVAALNLGGTAPNQKQDQLILHSVPDGGATIILLGAALCGGALIRRRLA